MFSLPGLGMGQHIPDADSLIRRLPELKNAEKVNALLDLCVAYLGKDKEKTIRYANEALKESERLQADTLLVRSLDYLGIAYLNHGEAQLAITTSERAIRLARERNFPKQMLDAMSNLASAYIRSYQNDKAMETALEGLDLAEKEKDDKTIVNFLEVIAEIQKDLKQWAAAEETYKKELVAVERLGRPFEAARAYNNFGLLYAQRGKDAEAARLFEKSRDYFKAMGYASGEAVALLNLADALVGAGNYKRARETYADVLSRNQAIQDPEMEALAATGMGVADLSTGNLASAKTYFDQAEKVALGSGLIEALKGLYSYKENLAVANGDYRAAWNFKKQSEWYADSLTDQRVVNRVTEMQVKYDTQKKETEIAEQRAQLLAQENALFRQRAWLIGLLLGVLALGVLGYLFHNRYRLRQKVLLDAAVIREQKLGLEAVIEAQETERRRIAKDLHDGIAQELVALKLGFSTIQNKVATAAPTEAGRLEELIRHLDEACTEVRNIAHLMIPPTLEKHGLAPSLQSLLRSIEQHAGMQTTFDRGELPPRLDEKIEVGIYRIAQELLNNILKHAKATQVLVQLYQAGPNLVLRIEDDGIGFDLEAAKRKGSMGILNILSRVNALGGVYFAEPGSSRGTVATIRVPCSR